MTRALAVSRVAEPSADERGLEARLRRLAAYAPDAWERWEEVSL